MISSKARIGKNVTFGAHVRVHDNVEIGDECVIGDFVILGHPAEGEFQGHVLTIGRGARIRSHTVLYEGSHFGPDLTVGHSALIREGVQAGRNLQVGSYNDLEGDIRIGDWVRFHSNVHIGRGAVIGDLVWIYPYAVLTNDPIPPSGLKEGVILEAGSVVCTSSVVLPGCHIGIGAFIAAMTRVRGIIPAGALVMGGEGKVIGTVARLKHRSSRKQHPWMNHFASNYPKEAQPRIEEVKTLVQTAVQTLERQTRKNRLL